MTTTDELLTLGEAALLADVSHTELVKAIEARRLPFTRSAYVQGSHESRLRIRRSDLERFAGHRWHGGEGRDTDAVDVLSSCDAEGCPRYAPDGNRCDLHGGKRSALPRPLTNPERTAYHEAGHAAVARELGWKVLGTSIVNQMSSTGRCVVEQPVPDTLASIADHLAFGLAGPIAAAMASRVDWRTLDLETMRASEERSVGDHFRAARDARFGADAAAAHAWLDEATAKAGERAHKLLERNWTSVAYTATRLLSAHTIGGAA